MAWRSASGRAGNHPCARPYLRRLNASMRHQPPGEYLLTFAHVALSFVIALGAGAFGSVLGIGGGLFIIPSLNLFLGVPLKTAIAASIVAVIATSLGGGNVYVRRHVADARLGLVLALATVPGAIVGALLATRINARVLAAVFATVLAASAYRMFRGRTAEATPARGGAAGPTSPFRDRYREPSTGRITPYTVARVPLGVGISVAAGLISGLLGVGGGIIQVPVMTLLMRVPIKVATATSTYVIGITAMAGAFVYYNHRPSYVDPAIAVPVTIGVFVGASAGSRLLGRLSQSTLRTTFTVVIGIYTIQMILKVFGIGGG